MENHMSIVKRLFADKNGQLVIGQRPNLPIMVWAGASILRLLSLPEQLGQALELLAFGALFTWAWLELFKGSCLFRRILGGTVLLLILGTNLQ
jgi:hypothetical protein